MFDIITPVLPAACCAVVRKDVNPYQVCFFNETSCAECSPRLPPHVRSCLSYILCRAPVVSEHCNWRCSRPSHLLRRTGDYNKKPLPTPSPHFFPKLLPLSPLPFSPHPLSLSSLLSAPRWAGLWSPHLSTPGPECVPPTSCTA